MTERTAKIVENAARLEGVWGSALPELTPAVRKTADDAVDGVLTFVANGKHPTKVGRRYIAWDGPGHAHQEWPAQLNRFFQLSSLAAAYRGTGDERYAEAARDTIEDWIRAHPTRPGWTRPPYDNVLNLCIRLGSSRWGGWLGTLPAFAASRAYSDEFVDRLLESACVQLDYLQANIAQDINWRIANADALTVCGLLLDPLPLAGRIRGFGIMVLHDAFQRQVLPDGAHFERNPGYHHWMASVMVRYWELARALPDLGLAVETEVVARMMDYSAACTAPNGAWNALHDCQGIRTGSYASSALRDRAAFRRKAGLPEAMPACSQYFPDAGQALLRDGWGPDATYLTFDATRWGGGHCHASRNSIQFHVRGKPVLVDPGFLSYEAKDPLCAHGKSTRAHNTLSINGWNQSATDPSRTRHWTAPGYDAVCSDYEGGYWPGAYTWSFHEGHGAGIWASHHRALLWVHGRFAVVLDNLSRSPVRVPEADTDRPVLEVNWQFDEGPVEIDTENRRVFTRSADRNLLMLFPCGAESMQLQMVEGSREPLRGWIPTDKGYQSAPQVMLSLAPMEKTWLDMATVLVPFDGDTPPALKTRFTDWRMEARFWTIALEWGDGTVDEIRWTHRLNYMIGETGDMVTDGSLLHVRRGPGGVAGGGAVFDATFLDPFVPRRQSARGVLVFPS